MKPITQEWIAKAEGDYKVANDETTNGNCQRQFAMPFVFTPNNVWRST